MKRPCTILFVLLFVATANAGKIVDITFDDGTLTDKKGGLTSGELKRTSDAYYETGGYLTRAYGSRQNIHPISDPDETGDYNTAVEVTVESHTWSGVPSLSYATVIPSTAVASAAYKTFAIVSGTTYVISCYIETEGTAPVRGTHFEFVVDNVDIDTRNVTNTVVQHIGGNVYRASAAWVSQTTGNRTHGILRSLGFTYIKMYVSGWQVEALPSGNTIGDDLFDQETLGSELDSGNLTPGTLYQITAQDGEDFTADGAEDNEVGTYFIATGTSVTLDANDKVKAVTAPAKGVPYDADVNGSAWPALAGSEVNTEEDASSPAGTTEADDISLWNNTDFNTAESEADPYIGTYSAHFVANGDGQSAVTDQISVSDNTFYRVSFWYKLAASDAGTAAEYKIGENGDDDLYVGLTLLDQTDWTEVSHYIYTDGTDVIITILEDTDAGDNDVDINIDYVSIRPVQVSWTAGTQQLELDETNEAIKITRTPTGSGLLQLNLNDANDLSEDIVEGNWYKLTYTWTTDDTNAQLSWDYGPSVYYGPNISVVDTFQTDTIYAKAGAGNGLQAGNVSINNYFSIRNLTLKQIPDFAQLYPSTYTPTTGSAADCPVTPRVEDGSLLVEGEAVNLLDYSEDFANSWTDGWGGTVTQNAVGPDGEANSATTITDPGGTGVSSVYINYTPSNQAYHVFSAYIKKGTSDHCGLWVRDTIANSNRIVIDYNWTNGVPVPTDDTGTSIEEKEIGNGWWRVSAKTSIAILKQKHTISVCPTKVGTAGAGKTTLFFGAQLEESPYPTSYIKTDGCPAIRTTEAGDNTNDTGYRWTRQDVVDNTFGASAKGTTIVYFTPLWDAGDVTDNAAIISLDDAVTSLLYYDDDNDDFETVDDTNAAETNSETIVRDTEYVVAIRYDGETNGEYLVSEKHSDTWTHSADVGSGPTYNAYALNADNNLWLAYGNEGPFKINRIIMYDEYFTESRLENEPWVGGVSPLWYLFLR